MRTVSATGIDKLQPAPVIETVQRLHDRIAARFPDRGLCRVAEELRLRVAEVESSSATAHGRRRSSLKLLSQVGIAVVVVLTVVVLALVVRSAVEHAPDDGLQWLPLLESAVNDLVFAALAIWFLATVPERFLRQRLLKLLHRLRSLAHIVDMHQLTKDPERLRSSFRPTPSSVPMDLTPEELEHYLDYCAELLSLIGKAAALCAEESQDSLVLDTVSTIETLTVSLERKIWQKISVLNADRDGPQAGTSPET